MVAGCHSRVISMAPKKKRRRKTRAVFADSGLGVSPQEKKAKSIQKAISVPEENVDKEIELRETECQDSQVGISYGTKEKVPLETEQGSLEENGYPEVADDLPEKVTESSRAESASSKEIVCSPNKDLELLETLEMAAAEANLSSPETEPVLNKSVHQLETEASGACRSDSDSGETMRELLQVVNDRSRALDKESEAEFPGCTTCADGCNNSHVDSLETEIYVGTSGEPRNFITSEILHNDENFSQSKICASQKTGQSVAGGEDIEEVIRPQDHDIPPVRHALTVVSHSCPEDIGMQRHILVPDRQRLSNPVLRSLGKKVPFRSNIGFQFCHPNLTGFHLSHRGSVIHESSEVVEQQNIERQSDASNQTLSVWSEAQSEYFPRGKPSDLGELLEVASRYVVMAWVKGIHPPISGPPTNLVIKFCDDCHRKYCYDENESHHSCSRHIGSTPKSLKLMFYVELEIYDDTQETLKVALTGDKATKLFGCHPHEFIQNEEYQKTVWNSFKHLLKGGNRKNWSLEDAATFSLEPHMKGKKFNYRVVDIRPFGSSLLCKN